MVREKDRPKVYCA